MVLVMVKRAKKVVISIGNKQTMKPSCSALVLWRPATFLSNDMLLVFTFEHTFSRP
jgi:hypothetical protein